MIQLKYPEKNPLLRMQDGREEIFCRSRKKWFVLTPEEWVRQNFLNYLEWVCGYPLSLIAIERQIKVGELNKRFDLVVFDPSGSPQIVVECKEMDVDLTEEVLSQVLRYNMVLRAPVALITNGRQCLAISFQGNTTEYLSAVPVFRAGST